MSAFDRREDRRKGCVRCAMLALLGLVALGTGCALVFVLFAVDWLTASDTERPADAIVVLAGAPERALYAADLYARGLAREVLLSRPYREPRAKLLEEVGVVIPPEEEINRRLLEQRGVPHDRIGEFGNGSRSTAQEMEVLAERYAERDASIIIVTSPLHLRRARLIARRILPGRVQLAVVGTPYETVPSRWWADQDAARNVVLETLKSVYFLAGGRFRSAPQP